MVNCGRKIKRRSKVKVTRHRKPLFRFINKFVGDENVKKEWDHTKTVRQNYEKLGLAADLNSQKAIQSSIRLAENAASEEFYAVPDSDWLKEKNGRRVMNHMSEEEIKYLRPLIAKYADDYTAMHRDIKINSMQWTENKLQRRCARLALLDANIIQG